MNRYSVEPGLIKLTQTQATWLVKMTTSHEKRLSLLIHEPPKRTMNDLVAKGLAKEIMGTFWELTELGQRRCTSIY